MDIQKRIEEALGKLTHIDPLTHRDGKIEIQENASFWLTHQQSIISQQTAEIERLTKERDYYKCPDCSPTDFEYCEKHFTARTEVWDGGDGY